MLLCLADQSLLGDGQYLNDPWLPEIFFFYGNVATDAIKVKNSENAIDVFPFTIVSPHFRKKRNKVFKLEITLYDFPGGFGITSHSYSGHMGQGMLHWCLSGPSFCCLCCRSAGREVHVSLQRSPVMEGKTDSLHLQFPSRHDPPK